MNTTKTKFLRSIPSAVAILALCVLSTGSSRAQLVASEFAKVSQTIDGTVIDIEYSRPSARGRSPLFGGVMAYGQIITPGANMATTFEFNKDVKIDGNPVPAGKYSVWVGFEKDTWTVYLDDTWKRFHGPHLKPEEAEVTISVTPREVAMQQETLTFSFPAVRADGATLRLHWGKTAVDMNVEVEPTPLVNIDPAEAPKYAGTYSVEIVEKPPFTIYSGTREIELVYENGFLHGNFDIGPYSEPHDMAMMPLSKQVFYPMMLMQGVPAQSFQGGLLFEFDMGGTNKAQTFQARFADDSVWMSGTRVD